MNDFHVDIEVNKDLCTFWYELQVCGVFWMAKDHFWFWNRLLDWSSQTVLEEDLTAMLEAALNPPCIGC
jgi:hypothetical protein